MIDVQAAAAAYAANATKRLKDGAVKRLVVAAIISSYVDGFKLKEKGIQAQIDDEIATLDFLRHGEGRNLKGRSAKIKRAESKLAALRKALK